MSNIKFGTSGWRDIIAEDFTFANVRKVAQAIADYTKSKNQHRQGVIVGGDTRFMSEKFSETATEVLCGNGIKVYLCNRDTPTPVISFEIIRRKLAGGINFTASHNPYMYQGLKFSPSSGAPATTEVTKVIEKNCESPKQKIKFMNLKDAAKNKLLEIIDPSPYFMRQLKAIVDTDEIKKANMKVAVDILHGTGRGYLDAFIKDIGLNVTVINENRDVLFEGGSPEPSKENLKKLHSLMRENKIKLGLSTDGDADRFGVIDEDGSFVTPNYLIVILLYHLVKVRNYKGHIVKSIMTTHLIDKIAKHLGVEVVETPVGFKYIGEKMLNDNSSYPSKKGNFIIGGEESGGLTIRGHVPEKDGILACLLALEAVSVQKKSLGAMLSKIMTDVGTIYTNRINHHLSEAEMAQFRNKLSKKPPDEIGGIKVSKIVKLDGYKFILHDGSWIGFRLSGTEPVVRVYLETEKEHKLKKLAVIGEEFVRGG